ncbi:MAG: class I SAM-dependent methyltransferase [Peptoniphilus sp.]|nr:class I SAM-dependent methyltransferase [Peptoniphilus sp.]MDY3118491.1 class I SAM-dependent methyltransferase [Peptoniphilus sp.]
MSEYEAFSRIYDQAMDNYDYDKVYRWIEKIVGDVPHRQILEMAMGTGKLTEKLTDLGQVTGFDRSEEMLMQAYRRLYKNPRAKWTKMDLRNFHFSESFDLIVCLCDGLNYLSTEADLLACFQRVRSHLNADGRFLFDLNTAACFQEYGDLKEIRDEEGYFLTWENHFDGRINCYAITAFIEEDDGAYVRFDEVHEEYVYDKKSVERLLRESGLKVLAIYDGYSFSPATERSKRISFVVETDQ